MGHAERVGRELVLIVYGLLPQHHPQPLLPKLLHKLRCHMPQCPKLLSEPPPYRHMLHTPKKWRPQPLHRPSQLHLT